MNEIKISQPAIPFHFFGIFSKTVLVVEVPLEFFLKKPFPSANVSIKMKFVYTWSMYKL